MTSKTPRSLEAWSAASLIAALVVVPSTTGLFVGWAIDASGEGSRALALRGAGAAAPAVLPLGTPAGGVHAPDLLPLPPAERGAERGGHGAS